MAVSMGFRTSVSLRPAIQATGPLALAPAGLTPAERVRLRWTHEGCCGWPLALTWWHTLPHKSTPRSAPQRVGVEMMVAHNPLHRSQRAELPHWALTSGDDAKAPKGMGVTNARRGQPAVEQPLHPLPGDTARVTAPRERTLPEPRHLVAKHVQRRAVHGHPVIADVPTNDQTQPPAHLRDRVVQTPPEFGFHLAQLRLHPLPARLPNHREPAHSPSSRRCA